jgi:Iron permease FTR1 family.
MIGTKKKSPIIPGPHHIYAAERFVYGSVLGLILAVLITYLIFKSSIKFNLKIIFKVLLIYPNNK